MRTYTTESEHYRKPRVVRDFKGKRWSRTGDLMGAWLLTPNQAAGILTSVMRSTAYNTAHDITRKHGFDGEYLTNGIEIR
jgi:hypothetical protein